tara:strand:- start:5027 stop:5527 length:501 start_codon:yes stop_codon:yes gene_type:complete
MASLNFKASNIQFEERTAPSYGPLPAGEYEVMIVKSDTKATKAGNGSYLELEMHVISGDQAGRRHWERLNLDNLSLKTVKIAEEQLARLCVALSLDEVGDSTELHDKPFVVEFAIDRKDNSKNVIYGYRAISGPPVSPAKLAQPKATPMPPPQAAPAKPAASRPWG